MTNKPESIDRCLDLMWGLPRHQQKQILTMWSATVIDACAEMAGIFYSEGNIPTEWKDKYIYHPIKNIKNQI